MTDHFGVKKLINYLKGAKNTSSFYACDLCLQSVDFICGTKPEILKQKGSGLVQNPAIKMIETFIKKVLIEHIKGWATRKADAFKILGIKEHAEKVRVMSSNCGECISMDM